MRYKNSMGGFTKSPIFKIILAVMPFGLVIGILVYFGKPLKEFISNLFGSAKSVTDLVGLTKSGSDSVVDAEVSKAGSPFSSAYYKFLQGAGNNVKLFTLSGADDLAKQLYSSFGFFIPTEFSEVFGVVKQCKYRTQVSFLCDRFYLLYKKDFLTYCRGSLLHFGLSSEHIQQIIDYVTSLPVGTY